MRYVARLTVRAIVLLMGMGVCALGDEITVKNQTLTGKVVGLTPVVVDEDTTLPGLAFETDYGKGKLLIPFRDMTALETTEAFHVLHGDDAEAVGRLLGVVDGMLLVGNTPADSTRVDVGTIHSVLSKEAHDGSMLADLKSRYRHWTASFDVGFSLTEATTDQRSFSANLRADRRKAPTRFLTYLSSRYGTQSRQGGPKNSTDDLLKGGLKLEVDLTDGVFAFGQGDATYDGIQQLSVRGVPQLGAGYRFFKTKTAFLQAQAGGAWVFEKYFSGICDDEPAGSACSTSRDSASVAFGAEAGVKLPAGALLSWTADYLPAVEDFAGDYLLRTEASLLVPMYSFVSAKLTLVDEYDSTPAQNVNPNRMTTTAGLALVF